MDSNFHLLQRRFEASGQTSAQLWLALIRLKKKTLKHAKLSAILGDSGAASLFRKSEDLPKRDSRRGARKKARAKARRVRTVRSWLSQFQDFDEETQSRTRLALGRTLLPFFDGIKRAKLEARELLRRSEQLFLEPSVDNRRCLVEGDDNFYWAIRGHRWVQSLLRPQSNQYRLALQRCTQDPPASIMSCFQQVWDAHENEMIDTRGMKNGLIPKARQVIALRIRVSIERELRPWVLGTGDPLRERLREHRKLGGQSVTLAKSIDLSGL
ncbi:MAG: hypothetical protein P1V97_21735 [Planctomycetota bacterium]|nr:hypothetical protein [Planctomycetota bacterium]